MWLAAIPATLIAAFLALAAYTFVPSRTPLPAQAFFAIMLTLVASLVFTWFLKRRFDPHGIYSERLAEARRALPKPARLIIKAIQLLPIAYGVFVLLTVFGPLQNDRDCDLHGGPFGTGCTITVNGQQRPGSLKETAAARRLYDLGLAAVGIAINTAALTAALATKAARADTSQPPQ